jgi:hypothetical protein
MGQNPNSGASHAKEKLGQHPEDHQKANIAKEKFVTATNDGASTRKTAPTTKQPLPRVDLSVCPSNISVL